MNRKQGFTLVEIMIVVLIIGLLAAIAVPNFAKAREKAQTNACIDNLRTIEGAYEQELMEGETPAKVADMCGNDKLIKVEPKCPANKNADAYKLPTKEVSRPTCPEKPETHKLEEEKAGDGDKD